MLDCYLYADHLFLFFADSRIAYVPYLVVIHELKNKYPQYWHLIDLIFLYNRYGKSDAAKKILAVPEMRDAMERVWLRAAQEIEFEINYSEIEKYSKIIGEWQSIPLDVRVYAMRLYVGCRDGLYESALHSTFGRDLSAKKLERCYDGKVTAVNASYNSIIISADWDGVFTADLGDISDEYKKLEVGDRPTVNRRSIRTNWKGTDIINYDTPSSFTYLNNTEEKIPKIVNYIRGESMQSHQRKRISKFADSVIEMKDLLSQTTIQNEDIVYSFNSSQRGYYFLENGSFVSTAINRRRGTYCLSNEIKTEFAEEDGKYQCPLSVVMIPYGFVVEFFDNVMLFKGGARYMLEDEQPISVRSYMSSRNYRDIVSVVSENKVTLHSLYTLDVLDSQIH